MVYTFLISSGNIFLVLLVMPIIGLLLIFLAFFTKKKNENTKGIKQVFYALILIGVGIAIIGASLMFEMSKPTVTVIGSGYISIETNSILSAGNINVSSSQIQSAFIGNVNNGNVTLAVRKDGTSLGNINTGLFSLSNNAMAYVATENNTAVFLKLKNGEYVVIGSNNTDYLAGIISKNVFNFTH